MTPKISTADAFYKLFLSIPKKDRLIAAQYILSDKEIRKTFDLTEVINKTTLEAFSEDKKDMPVFNTVDELRKDLLS